MRVGMANQSKQIRKVHISRERHWHQLVAMPDSSSSGSESSQVSPRVTKRDNSKPDASPFRRRFLHKANCRTQLQFFLRRLDGLFLARTKYEGIVVVAAEDDATVCLITDVSMVQQMERLFALMDGISLSVGFDGQVPSEKTSDRRNLALRGDRSSAEHVSKICNVSFDRVFVPVNVFVEIILGTKLARAEGLCWAARGLDTVTLLQHESNDVNALLLYQARRCTISFLSRVVHYVSASHL